MIWLFSIFTPLLLAAFVLGRRPVGPIVPVLSGLAALPCLTLSIIGGHLPDAQFNSLLLGTSFGIDQTRQIFLFFTSLLYFISGIYSHTYFLDKENYQKRSFLFFFLLCMCGNIGLLLSLDVVSFYSFFSLMALSAYGLISHTGSPFEARAGIVYIVLTLIGEAMLLMGMILLVGSNGNLLLTEVGQATVNSSYSNFIIAFLFLGFGVKCAVLPLHVWLPLAYSAAVAPGAAVMAGAMIKAGLFGWIYFLPLGEASFAGWSTILITMGLVATFYGVVLGLTQNMPKAILGYSSISQMGLITVLMGIALYQPEDLSLILSLIAIYALNHGLAKGALFIGVDLLYRFVTGSWRQYLILIGLLLSALAIVGAPFLGGSEIKRVFAEVSIFSPALFPVILQWTLPLSALGTAVLFAHFFQIIWKQGKKSEKNSPATGLWIFLLLALLPVPMAVHILIPYYQIDFPTKDFTLSHLWASTWPILLAIFLVGLLARLSTKRKEGSLPAGDILILLWQPLEKFLAGWKRVFAETSLNRKVQLATIVSPFVRRNIKYDLMNKVENNLASWSLVGTVFLSLILAIFLLFYFFSTYGG